MKRLLNRVQVALIAVVLSMMLVAPVAQAAAENFSSGHLAGSGWDTPLGVECDDGICGI